MFLLPVRKGEQSPCMTFVCPRYISKPQSKKPDLAAQTAQDRFSCNRASKAHCSLARTANCNLGAFGIMAAHTAHRCAQLPRMRSLPAIPGQQGLGSSHVHASAPLLRRCSTVSSRGIVLTARRQADRVALTVAAASTYENGYGSVGKPDEEVPAVDSTPTPASSRPAPPQPFYQPAQPASAPGALTRNSGVFTRWMCKVAWQLQGPMCLSVTSYRDVSFCPAGGDARIKVIGVGGGGNNAINRMIGSGLQVCCSPAGVSTLQILNVM